MSGFTGYRAWPAGGPCGANVRRCGIGYRRKQSRRSVSYGLPLEYCPYRVMGCGVGGRGMRRDPGGELAEPGRDIEPAAPAPEPGIVLVWPEVQGELQLPDALAADSIGLGDELAPVLFPGPYLPDASGLRWSMPGMRRPRWG